MKWLEIQVFTTDLGCEVVSGALNAAGIASLEIDESRECVMAFIREHAVYWDFADPDTIGTDEPCVKGYVADLPENLCVVEAARERIAALKGMDLGFDMGSLLFTITRVDDENWANNWKRYYKPHDVGKRLFICPSWEPCPPTERKTLLLDPGMAFGTGEHHTTRMCLELLDEVIKDGDSVLDLGCGSGILSISARILGAYRAIAVDIDPVCDKVARQNAKLNGVADDNYSVYTGDVLKDEELQHRISGKYEVVLANIVADVVMALAPFAKTCLAEDGAFIVSGIIDDRADEVKASLILDSFTVEKVVESGGWFAFLLRV